MFINSVYATTLDLIGIVLIVLLGLSQIISNSFGWFSECISSAMEWVECEMERCVERSKK